MLAVLVAVVVQVPLEIMVLTAVPQQVQVAQV
jgi:hypothetical protein